MPCVLKLTFLPAKSASDLNLRSNEDMQFGGKQSQDVSNALLDLRDLRFVLLQRVAVDDRRIDPLKIKQIIDVFGGTAGYDRKNLHVAAVIHDPGDLGRETNRRPLQQTTGQTYRPGIEPIS